jgi:hypothetical protein
MGTFRKVGYCIIVLVLACQGSSDDQNRLVLGDELDPEMYRPEIHALENDLYREPFDASARDATAIKLDDLADKVAQADGVIPTMSAVELRQLAGYTRMGKKANWVRGNWERIRTTVFADAAWYRWRHSPERLQVAAKVTAPRNDELRREYARILEKLEDLTARGKRDVERLGEPEEITTTYARGNYQYLVEDWADWADNWRYKLESIKDDMPDKPEASEDIAARLAHQNLERAIAELHTVPMGRGAWKTPFRNQWEPRFRRADKQLNEARRQIES